MKFKRTQVAEKLFSTKEREQIKLINFIIEISKRNSLGKQEKKQSISYNDEELEILKKIVNFVLFVYNNECPNFRTLNETKKLIENLLFSIRENRPFLIFALFCPSYRKSKGVVGFNLQIGETTKKGINNLNVLSEKATSFGIINEVYAFYSDLVLENFVKLTSKDLIDLDQNYLNFVEYAKTINYRINFSKISQIGECKQIVGLGGLDSNKLNVSIEKIKSIAIRSEPFYKGVLGWDNEDIIKRTEVLANSCLFMGNEVKKMNPCSVMVMTENIYERGRLYHAENEMDPLPIFYPHKTETKIDWLTLQ